MVIERHLDLNVLLGEKARVRLKGAISQESLLLVPQDHALDCIRIIRCRIVYYFLMLCEHLSNHRAYFHFIRLFEDTAIH